MQVDERAATGHVGENRLMARVLCLALTAAVFIALAPISGRITQGGGLGDDGRLYATMVNDFRTGARDPVSSLAAYRPLAPALVALSGVDVQTGFLALDIIAAATTAQAIFAILRRSGTSVGYAVLGVGWWLVLPEGPRSYLQNPVLTEAIALALMSLLALVALRRSAVVFALLLGVAVLARENLLVMLPLLFFALARDGIRQAAVRTAIAGVPAFAALLIVRSIDLVPVGKVIPLPGAALLNGFLVLLNIDDHTWRALFAILFTFGALPAVAIAQVRDTATLLRREPAWTYLAAATIATALVGGIEHERYAAPLALPLIAVAFGGQLGSGGGLRVLLLTAIHVGLCLGPFPGGGSDADNLARSFGAMPRERLAPTALVVLAGSIAAWLLIRLPATISTPPAGRAAPGRGG